MPELPHVAGFRRYLDATVVGRRVERSHVCDPVVLHGASPAALGQRVTGHRLVGTRRHGKYLGLAVDEDHPRAAHLVLHFAMTGIVRTGAADGTEVPYARLVLELDDGNQLTFACRRRLCRVTLARSFEQFVVDQGLGPDALDDDLDGDEFLGRLQGRRGTLKNALMDQSLLAGIGNEYADEILYQMRLRPRTDVQDLDDAARRRLWRVLRRVLTTAARHGGEVTAVPRWWLSRGRAQRRCPRCAGSLDHERVAGRRAWYCPRCQNAP